MNYELDSGVLVDANEFRAPELDRCLLALAFFILWYAFFFLFLFLGALHLQLNQLLSLTYTYGASVEHLSLDILLDAFFCNAYNAVQWTNQAF